MNVTGYLIDKSPDLLRVKSGVESIPGPHSIEYAQEIETKVKNGIAQTIQIQVDSKPIAEFVFEIYGDALFVLASYALTPEGRNVNVPERVQYIIEKIAKDKGCKAVEFQTARIALIKRASANSYHVKSVTMRKVIQ